MGYYKVWVITDMGQGRVDCSLHKLAFSISLPTTVLTRFYHYLQSCFRMWSSTNKRTPSECTRKSLCDRWSDSNENGPTTKNQSTVAMFYPSPCDTSQSNYFCFRSSFVSHSHLSRLESKCPVNPSIMIQVLYLSLVCSLATIRFLNDTLYRDSEWRISERRVEAQSEKVQRWLRLSSLRCMPLSITIMPHHQL